MGELKKESVALIFFVLLVGLVGGYGLGIAIYQPQISNMQSDISDIQSILLQNRTWHNVASFNLSTDSEWASSVFSIQGEIWRINWTRAGTFITLTGWTGFVICEPGPYVIDTVNLGPVFSGFFAEKQGTYYMGAPGNYFIMLQGIGADGISFTIESYY